MSIRLARVTPSPSEPTPAPSASPVAAYIWASRPVSASGRVQEVQIGTGLAYLLMIGAIEAGLVPEKSATSSSTVTFPSPVPFNHSYTSAVTNGNTETSNVAQFNTFSTLAGTGFTGTSQFVTLPTTDRVTIRAVHGAIATLASGMACDPTKAPTPAPHSTRLEVDRPLPYCA